MKPEDRGSCAANGGPGMPAWMRNSELVLVQEAQYNAWNVMA